MMASFDWNLCIQGVLLFTSFAAPVMAISCNSCFHETPGVNYLSVDISRKLDGAARDAIRAYENSYKNKSSPVRSGVSVVQVVGSSITFDGIECHGPDVGDIHDIEHTCEKFPGAGNQQECHATRLKLTDGGMVWIRGCIATKLCMDYEGIIRGQNSQLEMTCCKNRDFCNNQDFRKGTLFSAGHGLTLNWSVTLGLIPLVLQHCHS